LKVHADNAGYHELAALQRLKANVNRLEHVVELLDYFEHAGPNGTHPCLVLELMWRDVGSFVAGHYDWPDIRTAIAKVIAKQTLSGLETLKQVGIMHNGISHFGNANDVRLAPTKSSFDF
jgi:serine/threonine-protein kinase SRPK3